MAGQHFVEHHAQPIDVGARVALACAILFWGGIAWRAHGLSVFGLPWLEKARDAKINQLDSALGRQHYIRGLEVTKDEGRLLAVQVRQHVAQLMHNIQRVLHGQASARH